MDDHEDEDDDEDDDEYDLATAFVAVIFGMLSQRICSASVLGFGVFLPESCYMYYGRNRIYMSVTNWCI